MSKSENVTYQAVAKICNEMTAAGDAPSVRKLHAHLGGSFSTITAHLNQWREQQALAQSGDNALSAEFNQALLAEFARITETVKEKSKLQIAEKEAQLAEAIELLSAHENKLEECEKKYKALEHHAKSEQLDLEKKLAAAIGNSESAKQRELALQEKVDALIDKCHQAELRAVIAETKIEKSTPSKSK
jgi:DNA-binding transcriptional MocR family regulator